MANPVDEMSLAFRLVWFLQMADLAYKNAGPAHNWIPATQCQPGHPPFEKKEAASFLLRRPLFMCFFQLIQR